jgi:hypothetical protein
MNLDEIQAKWAQQDEDLATNLQLNRRILRRLTLERARRAMSWSAAWAIAGAVPGLFVLGWLGQFVYWHLNEPRFWGPGVLLHLYTLGLLVWTGRNAAARLTVDYSQSVAGIQRQIAGIRRAENRLAWWVVSSSGLAWVAIAIVMCKGLVGIDPYVVFGTRWLAWSLAFGLVSIPALNALARWIGLRAEAQTGFLRELMRDAGGFNLRRAADILKELEEIEK